MNIKMNESKSNLFDKPLSLRIKIGQTGFEN